MAGSESQEACLSWVLCKAENKLSVREGLSSGEGFTSASQPPQVDGRVYFLVDVIYNSLLLQSQCWN